MTMRSNKAIVNAAGQTITTAGLAAGGALNPEQAQKFIQQTFEATPLSGLVRHELRKAKTGEIDKIGNTSRHMTFEARNVVVSRKDINASAADFLEEPIVVARASGTCVTPKEMKRK